MTELWMITFGTIYLVEAAVNLGPELGCSRSDRHGETLPPVDHNLPRGSLSSQSDLENPRLAAHYLPKQSEHTNPAFVSRETDGTIGSGLQRFVCLAATAVWSTAGAIRRVSVIGIIAL
jgi:hypothetical protein